jgi:hypothetical protein
LVELGLLGEWEGEKGGAGLGRRVRKKGERGRRGTLDVGKKEKRNFSFYGL